MKATQYCGAALLRVLATVLVLIWQIYAAYATSPFNVLAPWQLPSTSASWEGAWSSAVQYSYGEIVTYSGSFWIANNPQAGTAPGVTFGQWTLFAALATSIAPGTTTISGGTSGDVEYNNAGVLGELPPTISGITLGNNLDALTFGTHLAAGGTSYKGSAAVTISSDATNADTASTIVARDSSGNFSAGTITAALTGHASLDLAAANNLSDVASASTARTNLGLGNLATQNAGTGLANSSSNLNLQPAQAATIGGVESITSASHQWIAYIDTSGVPHQSQPSFSDISGTVSVSQLPLGTNSTPGAVKCDGTTITCSGGVISTSGSGSGNVSGTGPSIVGNIPVFNNTTATGIGDSGIPYNAIPAANSKFTQAGTGAVATTLGARSQEEFLYVEDYGVDCSGTNDSTTAFTNAVAAALSGSVQLRICQGTIKVNISTAIPLTAPIAITGAGGSISTIENTNTSGNLFSIDTTSPIYFRDFGFTVAGTPTAGAMVSDAALASGENSHSHFEDVTCYNAYNCFYLGRSSSWLIHGSLFLDVLNQAIYVANANNGDSGDSTISDSQFLEYQGSVCATTGTDIYQQSSGGLKIVGNKFNCGSVQYELAANYDSSDTLITGNSFENCSSNCIYVTNSSSSFTWGNVEITGNEISPFADVPGIHIQGSSGWLSAATITGNVGTFDENSSSWARVDYAVALSFAGNSINGTGSTGSYYLNVSAGTVTSCHYAGNSNASLTLDGTCTNN